MDLTVRH